MEEFVKYYDVEKPAAFSGAHSFAKVAKKPQKWLQTQDAYTLHAPVRRKFPRRTDDCSWSTLSNASRSYRFQ